MINISYLEKRCKQLNLEKLPALNQLKLAYSKQDKDTVDRIASNIIEFLAQTYNVYISPIELTLQRASQFPSQRPSQYPKL